MKAFSLADPPQSMPKEVWYRCLSYAPRLGIAPAMLGDARAQLRTVMWHWKLYDQLKAWAGTHVVAEGLKFTLYDSDRLYRVLSEAPPGQRWHIISHRTLSNGITKRLWIDRISGKLWIDIDIDSLP